MERDEGNLYVLEGVLIALMLLGAAYGVGTLRGSSLDQERPRESLAKTAHDGLVVLQGLEEGNGTLLDLFIREAIHCVGDVAPSALQCDGERPRNLSFRIDSYLPKGGGWSLKMSNGIAKREIYDTPLPGRESVASSLSYGPTWNGTFVATELSCYQAGMDVRATFVPLDRAMIARPTSGKASAGALEVALTPAATDGWWEGTFPALTRPDAADVLANFSGGKARVPGATSYDECNLDGKGIALVTALRASTFAPSSTTVPIGSSVDFVSDLAALDAVAETSVQSATVTIYEPIGPRLNESDTWIPAAVIPFNAGVATWEPDTSSFYGTRIAMMKAVLNVDGNLVEARRIAQIQVALPTGEVPIDPPYRAILHVWMADWG